MQASAVHELGANVKKILHAKNPIEIQKNQAWSVAIFNIAAMLAAILERKIDENCLGMERILYAENGVKIYCGHTDDARRVPLMS